MSSLLNLSYTGNLSLHQWSCYTIFTQYYSPSSRNRRFLGSLLWGSQNQQVCIDEPNQFLTSMLVAIQEACRIFLPRPLLSLLWMRLRKSILTQVTFLSFQAMTRIMHSIVMLYCSPRDAFYLEQACCQLIET